jgi:hypothetical protein
LVLRVLTAIQSRANSLWSFPFHYRFHFIIRHAASVRSCEAGSLILTLERPLKCCIATICQIAWLSAEGDRYTPASHKGFCVSSRQANVFSHIQRFCWTATEEVRNRCDQIWRMRYDHQTRLQICSYSANYFASGGGRSFIPWAWNKRSVRR